MRTLKQQIADWITAERGGDDPQAESRLAGLIVELPELAPGAEFVSAVLRACGLDTRRSAWSPVLLWTGRVVELLALASAGLIALRLPEMVRDLRMHPPMAVLNSLTRLMIASLAEVLATGAHLLDRLSSIAYHAMLVSGTPEVMVGVSALLLTAFACFWSLQRLVSVVKEESK
jgi:hypothetical protein